MLENKIYKLPDLLYKKRINNIKLDLMIINENIYPPLVKFLDFNKYLYNIKKKFKKNLKNNPIKIIRLSPQISEHDIYFKMKKVKTFLKKKYKVKLYVFFKGRSIIYKYQGEKVLMLFYDKLKDICIIEKRPYMDYNKMFMIITPK
ncbi:MAG: translation initiation factor IF-3 [Candidatus Shikimatogenerans bostrichidophilus]|nr:MAG: translation initiation factor IF-3 [Candidatus Shikimatogenerans bostrichidophilus]